MKVNNFWMKQLINVRTPCCSHGRGLSIAQGSIHHTLSSSCKRQTTKCIINDFLNWSVQSTNCMNYHSKLCGNSVRQRIGEGCWCNVIPIVLYEVWNYFLSVNKYNYQIQFPLDE